MIALFIGLAAATFVVWFMWAVPYKVGKMTGYDEGMSKGWLTGWDEGRKFESARYSSAYCGAYIVPEELENATEKIINNPLFNSEHKVG